MRRKKRGLISLRSTVPSSAPDFVEQLMDVSSNYGETVSVASADSAMKIATVYRSVDILSGTIASLPLYIRRKTVMGHYAIDENNPLYHLLRWKASDRLNTYEMMESAVIQILLQGNAYIFPKFKDGNYVELVLLSSGAVAYDEFNNRYIVSDPVNGVSGVFDAWRIIHLRNKNLDGSKLGISTIQYASRILNISANADNQTLSNMKSGNKQKGFLTGGTVLGGLGKVPDAAVDRVAARLESELETGRSVMRLPGELKWMPYSISPADAQILENRKFSVFDICRFFGVHPDKVFVEQTSNYKASENSQTSFMTDTLQPLLVQIENEFSTKLLSKNMIGRKEIILYDREALYQLDPSTAASNFKTLFEIGGITANEVRVKQHREPKDGGDTQFVSANVAPINSPKIYGGDPNEKE